MEKKKKINKKLRRALIIGLTSLISFGVGKVVKEPELKMIIESVVNMVGGSLVDNNLNDTIQWEKM